MPQADKHLPKRLQFSYLGLGYLVLGPLVNPLLAGIGLHLPSITDLFAGLR